MQFTEQGVGRKPGLGCTPAIPGFGMHTRNPIVSEAKKQKLRTFCTMQQDLVFFVCLLFKGGGGCFSKSGPLTVARCLHTWVSTPQETTRCIPKSHLESSCLCHSEAEETNHLRPSTHQQGTFCNQKKLFPAIFPPRQECIRISSTISRSH